MKMINLGHKWPSPDLPVELNKAEMPERIDYPTIYLRNHSAFIKELPDTEFYVLAKAKVASVSARSNEPPSVDLELREMCVVSEEHAKGMIGEEGDYEESDDIVSKEDGIKQAFRAAVKAASMG
ncbi:hypothetical protein [Thiocapsa sp. N5-Cardenillas]|uniref:hypothetical protein n=1 Tax=Thiocapsa sp. N5-Cardenillas TaxID=3137397 RepID=UPI0035B0F41C